MDPGNKNVKLISSDGKEFIIDREVAKMSGTIKIMLESQFSESKGEIQFQEITGIILEKVVEYLNYKVKYMNVTTSQNGKIPNFDVSPEIALDLLMASTYLDC
jgi:transcription elongation factor B subunit 1